MQQALPPEAVLVENELPEATVAGHVQRQPAEARPSHLVIAEIKALQRLRLAVEAGAKVLCASVSQLVAAKIKTLQVAGRDGIANQLPSAGAYVVLA